MTITLSWAQTLDGRIATARGESRYISDEASLVANQRLRARSEAILVGIATVLADDPRLTCRLPGARNPLRVILDRRLRLPSASIIASTAREVPTLVAHGPGVSQVDKARLEALGCELLCLALEDDEHLSLGALVAALESRGVGSLMVEGGSTVLSSFVRQNLWHHLEVVTVAKLMGRGIEALGDVGVDVLAHIIEPRVDSVEVLGREALWRMSNPNPASAISRPSPRGAVESAGSAGSAEGGAPGQDVPPRTLLFDGPRSVRVSGIRDLPPEGASFRSRLMAISPGTEKQMFRGFVPSRPDPDLDCSTTSFTWPFEYGYINVVEDREGRRFFGFLPHREAFTIDGAGLVALPASVSDEVALFIPPLETAVSVVQDCGAVLGDRVLVTGAGVVGALVARLLLAQPGLRVTVHDPDGTKAAWFPPGVLHSDPRELMTLGPFDRVIEVSGHEEALALGLELVVDEGTVLVASWYGDRRVSLNLGGDFHRRRLKLVSSQVSHVGRHLGAAWDKGRRMALVLDLLGTIPVLDLLTHRFPFSRAAEAFELLDGEVSHGLVALVPWV